MKTIDNDTELKKLIKGIKLDSPGSDFASKVMSRVFEEETAIEKVSHERLLGKGFWIILSIFVLLIVAMFVFSNGVTDEGQLSKLLSSTDNGSFSQGYQSMFNNLGTLPLSIGGILLAGSVLLFIDKFLSGIMPHHSVQKSY
ncbi:MAG TPA: hypothetical protein PLC80_07460 [Draconibacterium sp.]|nr:hypothetical protein [Draconibacterium sp.]